MARRRIDRKLALRQIGLAWCVKSEFDLPGWPEMTTLYVSGPQSCGKTTFVERHARIGGFLVVKQSVGTKRPMEILTLPAATGVKAAPDPNAPIDIVVSESDHKGAIREATTRQLTTMDELRNWIEGHNVVTMDRLVIRFTSARFATPRRIVDLPGLRKNDTGNEEDTQLREVIKATFLQCAAEPNALMLCLEELNQQTSNSFLVEFLQTEMKHFDRARMIPIMTKMDVYGGANFNAFHHTISEWEAVFGVPIYLTGFTFENKVDSEDLEVRERQYRTVDARERKEIDDFASRIGDVRTANEDSWYARAGFDKIVRDVEDALILMDLDKISIIIAALQAEREKVDAEIESLTDRKNLYAEGALDEQMRLLSQQACIETHQMTTTAPSSTMPAFLSPDDAIDKFGHTLAEEEAGFMRSDYANDRIVFREPVNVIDYLKCDVYDGSEEFSSFIKQIQQEMDQFEVDARNCKLLPSVAMRRSVTWLSYVAYCFVRPNDKDRDRLRNALPHDPQLPNFDNALLRVKRVCEVSAAKLRPLAKYFVERVCFLLSQCFSNILDLQMMQPRMREIIDSLGGIGVIRDPMMRGFKRRLDLHGAHAFRACMSDMDQIIQQLGEFGLTSASQAAVAHFANTSIDDMKATREALLELVTSRVIARLPTGYSGMTAGVREALRCLQCSAHHDMMPAQVRYFVEAMIQEQLITRDPGVTDSQAMPTPGASVTSKVTNLLVRHEEKDASELLGFLATCLGMVIPRFVSAIATRCQCGLWMHLGLSPYAGEYQDAILEELRKTCGAKDMQQMMSREIELKIAKLADKQQKLLQAERELVLARLN